MFWLVEISEISNSENAVVSVGRRILLRASCFPLFSAFMPSKSSARCKVIFNKQKQNQCVHNCQNDSVNLRTL